MTANNYQCDQPADGLDAMVLAGSGAEPKFDSVMRTLLLENYHELKRRVRPEDGQQNNSLLQFASLGQTVPWLFRLSFSTLGHVQTQTGDIEIIDRHVVALRFLPDYLRKADRFAMMSLIEPANIFHPNINGGAICVQIHPGQPLVEICQSLHDLFRWRLRQYDERDALNPAACAWGRENIDKPIDDRPLFGKRIQLTWEPATNTAAQSTGGTT